MTRTSMATRTKTTQRQFRSGASGPCPPGRSCRPGRRSCGCLDMTFMLGGWCDNQTPPEYPRRRPAAVIASPAMVRSGHCVRPGCSEPATALLTYDYNERVVWLDRPGDLNGSAWPMCTTHADGLRVPMGWRCEDRRIPALPMARSVEPPEYLAC